MHNVKKEISHAKRNNQPSCLSGQKQAHQRQEHKMWHGVCLAPTLMPNRGSGNWKA
jgi:hypothetical protein